MADPRFQNFIGQLGINNTSRKGTGYNYAPFTVQQGQSTPGQTLFDKVANRKQTGANIYQNNRSSQTNRVAQDVAGKSAYNIPTDEFGLVNQTLTDQRPNFVNQIKSTTNRGKLALDTETAKNQWQQAKQLQDLGQYGFSGNIQIDPGTAIPGADPNNKGAQAVALAMKAEANNTPYVWGGNSLTKGVDCSGLVQQVYRQLGIEVPRTTYQQAKNGKPVAMNALRPGDLVFFNNLGHVGIYMGNGKYVHAANSKLGTITSSLFGSSNGQPELAIRPY